MPPNAREVVRRSNRLASKAEVSTSQSLKGNEIAIDGVIYDIADCRHGFGFNPLSTRTSMYEEPTLSMMKGLSTVKAAQDR